MENDSDRQAKQAVLLDGWLGWRNKVACRLANAALNIATPLYRAWIGGAIRYGLDAAVRDSGAAILVGGEVLHNVHDEAKCAGRACCIHHPSDHLMVTWRQHWRGDRQLMERLCAHGVGHPDPDDISPDRVHGCDGCCAPCDGYYTS